MGKEAVVPFLLEDKLKELGAKYEKVPILISTVSVSHPPFSGHLDGQKSPFKICRLASSAASNLVMKEIDSCSAE